MPGGDAGDLFPAADEILPILDRWAKLIPQVKG